jgi:hypothetical protein
MSHHHNRYKEPWWKEAWRPAAAAVYLFICLLDLGVMPLIYAWLNASLSNQELVNLALKFTDAAAQIQALQTLKQTHVWVPLTLQGNGMFHISFGAILGVAAFTRGQEKVAWASVGMQPGGFQPMNSGYSQPGYGMNNGFGGFNSGYNNGFSQPGFNQYPPSNNFNPNNNKHSTTTGKPAVDAGPSLDVANPDSDTNE